MSIDSLILEEDLIRDKYALISCVEKFSLALLQEVCMVEAFGNYTGEKDFPVVITMDKQGTLNLVAYLHQLVCHIKRQRQN